MLVSSIGYFDVNKVSHADNNIKNQPAKTNLSEGFGHYNQKTSKFSETPGFIKTFINAIKSKLFKSNDAESSKFTSLVA